MKQTVYLCGAINGCTDAECKDWRTYVTKELAGVAEILDPMRRDYRGREDKYAAEIVEGDLEDIDASTIVLVASNKPSWGTAMEMCIAYRAGKTVVAVCPNELVGPWVLYHSTKIFRFMSDAVSFIKTL